jgi:hypothetical protein
MATADRLDPRLFERIIDLARLPAGGRAGGMNAVVVMADAQGDSIRGTTQAWKATSTSGCPAIARIAPAVARLNASLRSLPSFVPLTASDP